MTTTTQALTDVLAERARMTASANWQAEEDGYAQGQMASAGACYAFNAAVTTARGQTFTGALEPPKYLWPLPRADFAPTTVREDLVRAAAMLLAEIERQDRTAPAPGGEG